MYYKKVLLFILGLTVLISSCNNRQNRQPVIYVTDLYHPFQDTDDHFDLVSLYSIEKFDIKATIIDMAQPSKTPGKVPIKQMNEIAGKNIPFYYGLKEKLNSPDDKASDQPYYQEGCNKIIEILKRSKEKVLIISVGSLRDVAAAFNREPELFSKKVDKLVIFIGEARKKEFIEYNVKLDLNAYIQIMNNFNNIYWVPCFDGGLWQNNGKASFWREHRAELLCEADTRLLNFFLYAFTKENDTINYISYLDAPVNETKLQKHILDSNIRLRDLWCCSVIPYFADYNEDNYPFSFEKVKVFVDSNAVLHYDKDGNVVNRFFMTDSIYYRQRMTRIFKELTKRFD